MNDAQLLTIAELSVGEYAPLRSAYKTEVGGALLEYLLTEKVAITKYKNAYKRAIADYFDAAFNQGYADGGGDPSDIDPDAQAWLAAKINSEIGFVDLLFQQAKQLKSDPETTVADYQAEAERRAEGYAKTLDGVYNEAKLRGSRDVLAEFGGEDGAESCPECQKYQGQRHKLSWWIKRGLIPGQPGNGNYSCHGYSCQHFLFNAKTGELLTI